MVVAVVMTDNKEVMEYGATERGRGEGGGSLKKERGSWGREE